MRMQISHYSYYCNFLRLPLMKMRRILIRRYYPLRARFQTLSKVTLKSPLLQLINL